jgi:hypothetical protein
VQQGAPQSWFAALLRAAAVQAAEVRSAVVAAVELAESLAAKLAVQMSSSVNSRRSATFSKVAQARVAGD